MCGHAARCTYTVGGQVCCENMTVPFQLKLIKTVIDLSHYQKQTATFLCILCMYSMTSAKDLFYDQCVFFSVVLQNMCQFSNNWHYVSLAYCHSVSLSFPLRQLDYYVRTYTMTIFVKLLLVFFCYEHV